MDLYEPPVSLWEIIKANTGAVELDEIRTILGSSAVDLSLDLRLEVDSLVEIWRAIREERKVSASCPLVDNTDVRKRLVSEIKLFIDSIKENPDVFGIVRIENLASRPAVKLALAEYDRYRPMSSIGSDGRETPSTLPSPTRSSPSRASSQLSLDDITLLKDRFKIDRVLEIVQHLRSYLEEEIAQLKDDVVFLRNNIEEENLSLINHPDGERLSIQELRSERNEVEAEVRWATENAALLRPLPPSSKRHGSVVPLEKELSSLSSISLAQSSSSSRPQSAASDLHETAETPTPAVFEPKPPQELKNIRVVSGMKARQLHYKAAMQSSVSPTASTTISDQQQSHNQAAPAPLSLKVTTSTGSESRVPVTALRPPLPPSARSLKL